MRFSVVLVSIVLSFLLIQEARPQTKTSNQRGPVPSLKLIGCSVGDSMPNGYRKSDDKTVMPNGYRKPETDAEMAFTMVEQPPAFPGGMKALSAFIKANLRLPDEARKEKITGRVFVSFVVERDGTISSPTILRSLGSGCDEEACVCWH